MIFLKKIFVFIALSTFSNNGFSMSIFNADKSCIFSEVNARVLINGEPVEGAKVTRVADWQKESIDEALTDKDGRFYFPVMYQGSITKLLPAEFIASQKMTVTTEGKSSDIWMAAKRDSSLNAELGGEPLNLVCELTDDLQSYRFSKNRLKTNCSWK